MCHERKNSRCTDRDAGREVLVIDNNESKIKQIRNITENAFVVGPLDKESLEDAGIQNCGTVIVCIGEKVDVSILTTLNVISMGVPRAGGVRRCPG